MNAPGVPVALYQFPVGCIAHVVMGLDMSKENATRSLRIIGSVSVSGTSRSTVSSAQMDCVGRSGPTLLSSTPRSNS